MVATTDFFPEFSARMRQVNLSDAAIRAFKYSYDPMIAGQTGLVPEDSIQPVTRLPRLDQITRRADAGSALLDQTVVIKLNGGLGTSMGLERAKSLLPVKNGLSFLDFIVEQILFLRKKHGARLQFLL